MNNGRILGAAFAVLAFACCALAIFFPDSKYSFDLEPSQLAQTKPGCWTWPLDQASLRLERFAVADTLSSVVFLGDRMIPLQSVHVRWPSTALPWHEIADGKLCLHLDEVRESQLTNHKISVIMIGAYSRVRAWCSGACGVMTLVFAFLFPLRMLQCLICLIHRGHWLAIVSVVLLLGVAIALRAGWMEPLAVQDVRILSEARVPWYAPFIWLLRRIESAGPGCCLWIALLIAVSRCRVLGWYSPSRRAIVRVQRALQRATIRQSRSIAIGGLALTALVSGWIGAGIRYLPDLAHYTGPMQGRLSWGDAADYLQGVQSLLANGHLTGFNQRRPINACLQAVRYGVAGGDRQFSMLIELAVFAMSLGLLTAMVARRFGPASAWAAFGFIWGFSRWYAASTLSELLGLTLGCWTVAVILMIRNRKDLPIALDLRNVALALLALAIATMAQTARPGALFGLPIFGGLIAVLAGRTVSSSLPRGLLSWRAMATMGAAVIIVMVGLMITKGLNAFYGDGQNQAGANFAHTLAGLTEGRSWSETMEAHHAEIEPLKTEGEVASFLYSLAFENMRNQPWVMCGQFQKAWYYFLRELPGALGQSGFPELGRLNVAKYIIVLIGFFACYQIVRNRRDASVLLLIALIVGIVLSVPIVFLDGKWRCLGATWPVLALGMSMSVSSNQTKEFRSKAIGQRIGLHCAWLILLVAMAFVGPCILHSFWKISSHLPDLAKEEIKPGNVITLRSMAMFHDTWIRVDDNLAKTSQAVDRKSWQLCMQESNVENLPEVLRLVDLSQAFAMTQRFDTQRDRLWWLVVPLSQKATSTAKLNRLVDFESLPTTGEFSLLAMPNLLLLKQAD